MKYLLPFCLVCSTLRAQAVGISYVYGTGQMGAATTTIAPIYVFVFDKDGNAVANSPVTWTVTQGAPGLVNPPPQTTMSNANGIAMSYSPAYLVDPSQSYLLVEVDARGVAGNPVKFLFTSLATTASVEVLKPDQDHVRVINTSVGAIEKAAYQVAITASDGPQGGQAIANVGLRASNVIPVKGTSGFYDLTYLNDPGLPSAACVNNTLSDADGIATCDMQIGPRVGTTKLYMVVGEDRVMPALTLIVGVGAPAKLSISGGSGQTGRPGEKLALPLRVRVTDSGGNPTVNTSVGWTVLSGSAVLAANHTVTDVSGETSNTVTLGATPGPVRIRTQINQATFVEFDLTVTSIVSGVQVVSGDDQSVLPGATFPNAFVVQVLDGARAPLAGVPVTFTITAGGSVSASSVTTNASGIASVFATAGPDPGPVTVTATAQGFQAVFSKLMVFPPGPLVSAAGIRNAASGEAGLTACGLASLKGVGLAPGVDGVVRSPDRRTTALGPVDSITVGGIAAVLVSVANQDGVEQIVMQTPCSVIAGPVEVDVSVLGLTSSVPSVNLFAIQPGVFEVTDDAGHKLVWATHADGSAVNALSPATRGEVVRIFATGLGPFSDSPDSPEAGLLTNLILGINDAGVPMVRSGYLVDQPGFYFVEVAIPADLGAGASNARFVIGEAPSAGADLVYSNTVVVPIR